MSRLVSNRDVARAAFDTVAFEGEWLRTFGNPELRGVWTIFGTSGSGKTTFALMLCKYLSSFRKTMYNSLEQGLSLSMKIAWNRVGMQEAGRNIVFGDMVSMDEIRERLAKRKSPQVVLVDSITAIHGFRKSDFAALTAEFPQKLFIFIAHEKNGKAHPAVAEHIRCLSDVKIHVYGYKAYVVSRFADSSLGQGKEPFIIWEDQAKSYSYTL